MEKVLGGTHTSSKVYTSLAYSDAVDESCRTLWLLVICAQRTREPITYTYTYFVVLLNSDAVDCCLLVYFRAERLAGGLP